MTDIVQNRSEATIWLTEALTQLAQHCASLKDAGTWAEIRIASHAGQGRMEVWWRGVRSRLSSDMLWDKVQILEATEADMVSLLEVRPTLGSLEKLRVVAGTEKPAAASTPRAEPPMFAYHPQRLRTLLPFGREVARLGKYGVGPIGVFTRTDVTALGGLMQAHLVAKPEDMARLPIRKRVFGNEEAGAQQSLMEMYFHFMWFERSGRNIFDVPRLMSEMFQHTDLDDLPASEIKLPYQSVYLAIHPQEDLQLRDGWPIDGAYVVRGDDGSLHIGITARPPSVEAFVNFLTAVEPVHTQVISSKYMSMTLGQAITHALADDLRHIEGRLLKDMPKEVQTMLDQSGVEIADSTPSAIVEQRRLLMERQALYERALRLIINSLMYLTYYPDDIDVVWPEETPERLREQATNVSERTKRRRNAESKLMALGYTAIHLCGRKFREDSGARAQRSPGRVRVEHGEERTTWVRGFWTPQAHGPKWSLRKWIWRRPHKRLLHSSGAESDDGTGHLYLVS